MALCSKILRKEQEKITALSQTTAQGRTRRGLDVFTATLNIPMDIKGNPMLRQLKPNKTLVKFENKNKYYEYHENFGYKTSECRELKRALMSWPTRGP